MKRLRPSFLKVHFLSSESSMYWNKPRIVLPARKAAQGTRPTRSRYAGVVSDVMPASSRSRTPGRMGDEGGVNIRVIVGVLI